MEMTNYKLILGSNSPRRKELLSGIDNEYEIVRCRYEESYPETLPKEEVPDFLHEKKASAYVGMFSDDSLLLTADTIVLLDGTILGKLQIRPKPRECSIFLPQKHIA
jgi:septum formation protein